MVAARKGSDPSINSNLRLAIDNAKADNVPNANIERAIKRGTGELKEGAEISEITYEGYGPGGIAFIVESLTDNKNRTLTNLRTLFDKNGGRLGDSGSVAYLFERKEGIFNPKYPITINDQETAKKLMAFTEALENDLDVTHVTTNADIPEKLRNLES